MSYTVGLRDLIQDPYVTQELDRIAAALQAVDASIRGIGGGQSTRDAEAGLDTGKQVNTRPIADDGQLDNAIRWLKGPWLLNADGNVKGDAVLRPPQLTGDANDYAPVGMDTCIGLELDSTTTVTLTGLKIAKIQRRIVFLLNKGQSTISLAHESTSSLAQHRFSFGDSGETLAIPAGRVIWFFYDTDVARWRLFALPAIDPANLPASLVSISPVSAKTVSIANADALTLNTVPIELVAAPGAGKLVFLSGPLIARVNRTTGYGTSPTSSVFYNNDLGGTNLLSGTMALLSTGTVNRTILVNPIPWTKDGAASPLNQAMMLRNSANTTGGSSSNLLELYVTYRTLTVIT